MFATHPSLIKSRNGLMRETAENSGEILMKTTRTSKGVLAALIATTGVVWGADDWPMHLHDAERSGFSDTLIELPLSQHWLHVSASAPEAAWAPPIPHAVEGNLEINRLDFDLAFQVAASAEAVYFGSSSDDQVRCLDSRSGKVRWSFFADGPVRLGPSLDAGRLYFGSDDGFVYCLDAESGSVIWKRLLGFDRTRHLGNGRLISRWPVRSGILIRDGIAYCGAGVFPHEGIILCALEAESGDVIWMNDTLGEQDNNRSRLAPQGYLLANEKYLYVPSGRDLPAAFYRKDGKKRFHAKASWRADGIVGGTYGVLVEDQLITGANQNVVFDAESGKSGEGWFHGRRIVVRGETAYFATTEWVAAVDRKKYAAGSIKLHKMRQRHDGRGGDDPVVLEAKARHLLRAEESKNPKERNGKNIANLKKEVLKQAKALKAMLAEEEAHEASLDAVHWKTPIEAYSSLIATRDVVFAGGQEFVVGLSAVNGKELWRAPIHGKAAGLAVAGGKLLVSSDSGRIYCFGTGEPPEDAVAPRAPSKFAGGTEAQRAGIAGVLHEVTKALPRSGGYALVAGLETGELAWELMHKAGLKVIAIDPDAQVVAKVRKALGSTGVYGSSIHVLHGSTEQLPNYFANVVVSESALFSGKVPYEPEEIASKVRPLGGTVLIGQPPGSDPSVAMTADDVKMWLNRLKLAPAELGEGVPWGSVSRGALNGAGSWTHQYGTSGNTGFSNEKRLTAPLGVLWYGAPGPTEMINRHSQGTPPVSLDGRMFIVGENVLLAYDAYNGSKLWEASYEGQSRYRTQSVPGNIAADKNGAFLATKNVCYRFHPETGEVLNRFEIPEEIRKTSSTWSYLGVHDGIVIGSMSASLIPGSGRSRYSKALFAYETGSGKHLWTYQGDSISQMTIAVGDGRVFLVDGRMTTEQLEERLKLDRSHLAKLTGKAREEAEKKIKAADRKLAVALDLKTGNKLWSKVLDFTNCTGLSSGAGELMMMYHDQALVFAGASGNGHYWKQFLAGEFKQRKLAVVDASTGRELWHRDANYRIRPLVMGETIVAEPWAYDLRTGKQKTRRHPTTGEESPWEFLRMGHHCGHVSATENLLFFRSGSTAYYDLKSDAGVSHFSGMRTGCTINMIPANGLLHIPEASAGCQCLFAIQSTVTLEPVGEERDRAWGIFATPGPVLPVKHLHLNFGAPGDRRDHDGNLWLSYPRPRSDSRIAPLELNLDLEINGSESPTTYMRTAETRTIKGTDKSWIYSSGYEGIEKLGVAVIGPDHKAGLYTVRLHFAELEQSEKELREFDISLQGKVVEKDLELRTAAESPRKAIVREFKDVEIFEWLEIGLTPHADSARSPTLAGLQIIRTGDLSKPKPVSYRYPPEWPKGKPEIVLKAIADSRVSLKEKDRNEASSENLTIDGGADSMNDSAYSMLYLKFDLSEVPGQPIAMKLRLKCLGAGSRKVGDIYQTGSDWEESGITFNKQPQRGVRIGQIGHVGEKARLEKRLISTRDGADKLSLLLQPTSTDGIRFGSRESKTPPELVVVYEPE
ncbi:MAG: hypothetical protein CMN05_12635 [Roseibacillus sp.]|nr:hypothetical protein [Roseibacillus sp.]